MCWLRIGGVKKDFYMAHFRSTLEYILTLYILFMCVEGRWRASGSQRLLPSHGSLGQPLLAISSNL